MEDLREMFNKLVGVNESAVIANNLTESLWEEFEQLIASYTAEAKYEEVRKLISIIWDTDGSYYYRDDVPHEVLDCLAELKTATHKLPYFGDPIKELDDITSALKDKAPRDEK